MSNDLKAFIGFLTNPILEGILGGAAVGAAGGAFLGGVGAIPGAIYGGIAGGVAGAAVKGVSSIGASSTAATTQSQSAVPPAPNFDATFSAVTVGSLGFQAAQAKAMVSALGSAATAQDKLDATTKQLNFDLSNGRITQDTYNKALSGANLDAAIAKQSTQNKSIGASPGACELAAVVERVGKSAVPKENRTPALINQDEKLNVGDEYNLPAAA